MVGPVFRYFGIIHHPYVDMQNHTKLEFLDLVIYGSDVQIYKLFSPSSRAYLIHLKANKSY